MIATTTFTVPTRDDVSAANQAIFDQLTSKLGMVPNLYATFAHSDSALGDYLALQNRKSSLRAKEREVINLVVSQINDCHYCLAAHTVLGGFVGFTPEQIVEIRRVNVQFDVRLAALAQFTAEVTIRRGKPSHVAAERLLEVGYTPENIVDIVIAIGDKIITNYLHGVTEVPIDFPAAPAL